MRAGLLLCLLFHPLVVYVQGLRNAVDEWSSRLLSLLSHPSPLLSFHFTLPLLFFLVTPLLLCLSLSPLFCSSVAFSSLSLFDLISIPPSPACSVSQHRGPSLSCSMRVCMHNRLRISRCTATGGSTDLFICCHPVVMKR